MSDQEKTDVTVAAAGNDPDSRVRQLKTLRATAEASGDDSQVDDIDKQIKKVRDEQAKTEAAEQRKAAAGEKSDDKADRTSAPEGRTARPKSQS